MKSENPFVKNQDVTLSIDGMTSEGQGVAHLDGVAFFVPETVPGETVVAHIIKVEKRFCIAKKTALLTPSPARETPRCEAYSVCGGCTMQHMTYAEQLLQKQGFVRDALERLGGFRGVEVLPALGMDEPWRYRNKGSFPFGTVDGAAAFGFYAPRSHRLIPLFDCPIQSERVMATARAIAAWANKNRIPVYDETTGRGTLRACMVRETTEGKRMAVVVTHGKLPHEAELVSALRSVDSLYHNRNDKDTNVLLGESFRLLSGTPTLTEEQDGLLFAVSPQSFLQVNPAQTRVLYRTALEFLQPQPNETVVDLYCGIGTISLQIAKRAGRVIGVECVPEAIEDAKANAVRNSVGNAEFLCELSENALPKLLEGGVRPDAIVLDPPRKGCEPAVLNAIAKSGAPRVVYVSCNPATLARDLKLLCDQGYALARVRPVDMFPQTHHVETAALMTRNR
ncbi:MAG: 23S rRNA (uracil(1939)-C(5))-methyltransferase RlmD [Clostridia bacterium]|nr:23S rRNA (uracil(1939)-C(5))-methyltransferase RlmD [Clostridia bacterium]